MKRSRFVFCESTHQVQRCSDRIFHNTLLAAVAATPRASPGPARPCANLLAGACGKRNWIGEGTNGSPVTGEWACTLPVCSQEQLAIHDMELLRGVARLLHLRGPHCSLYVGPTQENNNDREGRKPSSSKKPASKRPPGPPTVLWVSKTNSISKIHGPLETYTDANLKPNPAPPS